MPVTIFNAFLLKYFKGLDTDFPYANTETKKGWYIQIAPGKNQNT